MMNGNEQQLMYVTWSLSQLLLVLVIVVLLFGRGKISELMGDLAKGIKSFKAGLSDSGDEVKPQTAGTPKPIEHDAAHADVRATTGTETKA
jgi:sec-independent protein translocase protein TatA